MTNLQVVARGHNLTWARTGGAYQRPVDIDGSTRAVINPTTWLHWLMGTGASAVTTHCLPPFTYAEKITPLVPANSNVYPSHCPEPSPAFYDGRGDRSRGKRG